MSMLGDLGSALNSAVNAMPQPVPCVFPTCNEGTHPNSNACRRHTCEWCNMRPVCGTVDDEFRLCAACKKDGIIPRPDRPNYGPIHPASGPQTAPNSEKNPP